MIAGVLSLAFSVANASFFSSKGFINIDGVVASVGATSLTVYTAGSVPVVVDVYEKNSKFYGSTSPADLMPGDRVNIVAHDSASGNPLAKNIKKLSNGPGYGTTGDMALAYHGSLVGKTTNTLTVDNGLTTTTFYVLISTTFMGKSFAQLALGDMLDINGEDSGTHFVARTVFVKR